MMDIINKITDIQMETPKFLGLFHLSFFIVCCCVFNHAGVYTT